MTTEIAVVWYTSLSSICISSNSFLFMLRFHVWIALLLSLQAYYQLCSVNKICLRILYSKRLSDPQFYGTLQTFLFPHQSRVLHRCKYLPIQVIHALACESIEDLILSGQTEAFFDLNQKTVYLKEVSELISSKSRCRRWVEWRNCRFDKVRGAWQIPVHKKPYHLGTTYFSDSS